MKPQTVEAVYTLGYLASSQNGEQLVSIVKQYWSREAIRFDSGSITTIARSDGRMLYVDHSSRRVTHSVVTGNGDFANLVGIAGVSPSAAVSALRESLRENGVVLGDRPTRSRAMYLNIPCTIETYHDQQKEPVLTLYLSRLRDGPGLLRLLLLMARGDALMVFVWDTMSYAKVKLPTSAFDVPSGYTIAD